MASAGFGLKSRRVLTPDGLVEAIVVVRDGRIAEVIPSEWGFRGPLEDLGTAVLAPGIVDCHVHINEPGRTEWEGFETATQAAAAGGITTVVDMPLNCIPVTTSALALEEKLAALEGKLWVDCGFWGGVLPDHDGHLAGLLRAGVMGAKAFLIDSGIDEFPNVARADLERAMPVLARHGVPLLVHAELETSTPAYEDPSQYRAYLASRPRAWENDAIRMMLELARETGCRTHIVHLSSADCLPAMERARQEGVPFTVETCPHYLTLCAEEIPDGDPRYKCAPPIREQENRERLWDGLARGVIDFIVSDHSPCTPRLKHLESGNVKAAWGGISGLQFGLSLIWAEAQPRGFTIEDVARWMSERTAAFAGMAERKGRIAPGYDADLVVWDPETTFRIVPNMIRHRHKVTPYEGKPLRGKVIRTYTRGRLVYRDEELGEGPAGRPLLRYQ